MMFIIRTSTRFKDSSKKSTRTRRNTSFIILVEVFSFLINAPFTECLCARISRELVSPYSRAATNCSFEKLLIRCPYVPIADARVWKFPEILYTIVNSLVSLIFLNTLNATGDVRMARLFGIGRKPNDTFSMPKCRCA